MLSQTARKERFDCKESLCLKADQLESLDRSA